MERMKNKEKSNKVNNISKGIWAISALCIVPVLINCLYILPSADDFTNAAEVRLLLNEGHTFFSAAIARTVDLYINTSGYFFASFLNMFFTPILRSGIEGIRIFSLLVYLSFYIILYYFIKSILSGWMKINNKQSILVAYVLIVLCFTNIRQVGANYWYCFLVAYLLPIVVGMLGLIFFEKALYEEKWYWIVGASLLGFFVSGSSLNITAMICIFYLLMAAVGILELGKKKISIVCFSTTLLGGILNLLSPGNYTRHDSVSESYNITEAILYAIDVVFNRVYKVMTSSILPFILILLFLYFLCAPLKRETYKKISIIWMLIIAFGSLVTIAFPVALGYGTQWYPERCIFVQDVGMYFFFFIIIIYSANRVREKWFKDGLDRQQIFVLISMFILSFFIWCDGKKMVEVFPIISVIQGELSGDSAEIARYWESVFEEIESSENEDVVVYKEVLTKEAVYLPPGLLENSGHWVNSDIARYYNKKSICIIYER